jgi:hypothetical protein
MRRRFRVGHGRFGATIPTSWGFMEMKITKKAVLISILVAGALIAGVAAAVPGAGFAKEYQVIKLEAGGSFTKVTPKLEELSRERWEIAAVAYYSSGDVREILLKRNKM